MLRVTNKPQWILRDWPNKPETLAVSVPSVAVFMSVNYLLHPFHSWFSEIRVVKTEPFSIERRLWREGSEPA